MTKEAMISSSSLEIINEDDRRFSSPSSNSTVEKQGKEEVQESLSAERDNQGVKPKKKRKTTNRACDACAIRKVKCQASRPCSHCVNNNLNCTQLRERKKSGPKNLHKKTLESINSFSVNVGVQNKVFNVKSVDESAKAIDITSPDHPDHPVELVPQTLRKSLMVQMNNRFLTPSNIIEILRLLDDQFIHKCLQKLTINSLLFKCLKMINFIRLHFPLEDKEIYLRNKDVLLQSKLLVIFSLCLLIVENVLKIQNTSYRPQNSMGLDKLKQYKNSLQILIAEAQFPLDQLSIFPLTSTLNGTQVYQQVYYNQSLSSVHLLSFHEITNYLYRQNQDQQKLIHLRKAITYYQLIIPPFRNSPELSDIQVYELFETLFTMESLYFFLSSDFIIKSNNVLLNEWHSFNLGQIQREVGRNSLFEIFKTINKEELIHTKAINFLFKFSPFNYNKSSSIRIIKETNMNTTIGNASYNEFKNFLNDLINEDNMFKMLRLIILFKIIIIHCNELNYVLLRLELIEIVKKLNEVLNVKTDLLRIQISNYQLVPHLLQVLRLNLEIDDRNVVEYRNELDVFTNHLISLLPICSKNSNKIIRSNQVLSDWFKNMSLAPKHMGILEEEETERNHLLLELLDECNPKMFLDADFPSAQVGSIPNFLLSFSNMDNLMGLHENEKEKDKFCLPEESGTAHTLETSALPVSNSSKNLFNFASNGERPPSANSSLSNLFQFGVGPRVDWPSINDEMKLQPCQFSL